MWRWRGGCCAKVLCAVMKSLLCRKLTCSLPLANPLQSELSSQTLQSELIGFFFKADAFFITALGLLKVMAPILGISGFLLIVFCFLLPSSEQGSQFLMPPGLHAWNWEGWWWFGVVFSGTGGDVYHCTELSPVPVYCCWETIPKADVGIVLWSVECSLFTAWILAWGG